MFKEEQIQQIIGQLQTSINKIEPLLEDEEFKDYCDSIGSAVIYWQVELKKVRDYNKTQ